MTLRKECCEDNEGFKQDTSRPFHKVFSLQVLTYNVWIAPLVRWNPIENLEAICKFIESLDVDIVCLQEVSLFKEGLRVRGV
jgi:endonuclease/exonuclease/phosphatase family metal-dependent hydrolase